MKFLLATGRVVLPPPGSGEAKRGTYQAAWTAIFDLIKRGDSWSGNERNCVFLNCGSTSPRFANIAAVSGLDFRDDGRSVASTDWDGDGDLDLWLRNRTAPRLRLMLNQSDRNAEAGRFVSFKLQGTRGNRDGIGARVEVRIPHQAPLIRTLRAGEAFLSQSTKTLHVGLGNTDQIESVTVRWPGGEVESFPDIAPNGRYLLREGAGKAQVLPASPRPAVLAVEPQLPAPENARASVLLPRRVPLPPLSYQPDPAANPPVQITPGSKPLLVLLWASWCPACHAELKELAEHRTEIEAARLDILALAMDELRGPVPEAPENISRVLAETGFPYQRGSATPDLLGTLRVLEEQLFDRYPEFAVPYSFLLSPERDLIAIYRGRIPLDALLFDTRQVSATDNELRDLALPFPGRWYTRPYSRLQMLEHFADLTAVKAPEASLHYLERALAESVPAEQKTALQRSLAVRHYQRGHQLMVEPATWEDALQHFKRALELDPEFSEAYHARGAILGNQGRHEEARRSLERALELSPGDPEIKRKLGILRQIRQP